MHLLLNTLRKLDCYRLQLSDISGTDIGRAVATVAVLHPRLVSWRPARHLVLELALAPGPHGWLASATTKPLHAACPPPHPTPPPPAHFPGLPCAPAAAGGDQAGVRAAAQVAGAV